MLPIARTHELCIPGKETVFSACRRVCCKNAISGLLSRLLITSGKLVKISLRLCRLSLGKFAVLRLLSIRRQRMVRVVSLLTDVDRVLLTVNNTFPFGLSPPRCLPISFCNALFPVCVVLIDTWLNDGLSLTDAIMGPPE